MYSIKPGRGPSAAGVVGGIIGAVFGVFWTFFAASIGAPWFFVLFGVVFVGMAIASCFYNFHNATSQNRFSNFDIVQSGVEPDPLNPRARAAGSGPTPPAAADAFCPYCGAALSTQFNFCPKCGKPVNSSTT
jgi:hypothetical protein